MIDRGKRLYEKNRHLIKNLSINVTYRVIIILITLFCGILMSRDLLEAKRGIFSLFISSLILFNNLFNFGLNSSSAYYAKDAPEKMRSFLNANFFLSIVSSILIFLILTLFSQYFKFQSTALTIVFIVVYLLFSFQLIFRSFLMGQDESLYTQKIDFYIKIIYLAYILFIHFMGLMTVINVVLFLIFDYLAFSIYANKKLKISIFPIHFDYKFFKDTFKINSKMYLSSIMTIAILKGDQYFIKKFLGNYHVGLYSIGGIVIDNLGVITSMFCVMYLPKLIEEKNLILKLTKVKKVLFLIFGLSFGIALFFYFLSPFIIELYFKKTNFEASQSLQILLIGFIFWSLYSLLSFLYLSIRVKKSSIIILFLCLTINFGLNYIFIPTYGIRASAWASSFCYFLLFVLSYIDLFFLKKKNFLKKSQIDIHD